MIQQPNSLWVELLKSIYFPNNDFLKARKRSRSSWLWKSFLSGQDALFSNIIWVVGDGERVSFWRDKWIPSLSNYMLAPRLVDSSWEKLKDYKVINKDLHYWDLTRVENLLNHDEIYAIKQIPISYHLNEDRLVWTLTNEGVYSVKSSYHNIYIYNKLQSVESFAASSSYSMNKQSWKTI